MIPASAPQSSAPPTLMSMSPMLVASARPMLISVIVPK